MFAAFGTFLALPEQAAQVRCVRNAASKLAPDGLFLMEALVPRPSSIDITRTVSPAAVEDGCVVLNAIETDPVRQTIHNQQIAMSQRGARPSPID